jgi:DMSO/TMAO reductase YedYZ heme-binding membrane subunit
MSALVMASGNTKMLWYLTRGTGAIALLLLTAAIVLGVMSSTRWHGRRLPRPVVSGLHRNVTLLAFVFVVVHVVTTVADGFAPIGFQDAVLPFLSPYRPVWLGLGAVAFDLLVALIITSLLRARIGLRTWRAVHWLAYASWPVALVHALGSGSDARAGWLVVIGIACAGVLVATAFWRVTVANGPARIRLGAAVVALALPVAILAWASGGPLRRGWAARAGTPASLRASARAPSGRALPARAVPGASAPSSAALPGGSFAATFHGRLQETPAANGLVVVTIDGVAQGGFAGRLHLALRGTPLGGGGVQMIDNSVGLLPTGASAWSAGHVVALQGERILADVQAPGGQKVHVELALRIDLSSGAVRGSIHGGSGDAGTGPSA